MRKKGAIIVILLMFLQVATPFMAFAKEYELQWILEPSIPIQQFIYGFENDGLATFGLEPLVYNPRGERVVCSDPNLRISGGLRDGLMIAKNVVTNKIGFADASGNLIIPAIYDDFSHGFNEGIAIVSRDGWLTAINKEGKELLPLNLYKKSQYNGYGSKYFITISDQYKFFEEDRVEVYGRNGDSVNFLGTYAQAMEAGEGVMCVSKIISSSNWGAINTKGEHIFPFISINGFRFSEGLASVWMEDKTEYIDTNGKIVLSGDWSSASNFKDGYATVYYNKSPDKIGIIDRTGKTIATFSSKYSPISMKDGMITVRDNTTYKSGIIDAATGKIIVPLTYDEVEDFSEGVAVVKIYTGKRIKEDDPFSEDIYHYGLVDKAGNVLIPADGKYTYIGPCKEGMIYAGHYALGYGYLDRKGNPVYPQVFPGKGIYYANFAHGAALQRQNGLWGILKNPLPESERQYNPERKIISFEQPKPVDIVVEKEIGVYINGRQINFPDEKPYMETGRTMVPLRVISEEMGYKVEFIEGVITISTEGKKIQLKLGEAKAWVNNVETTLDARPILKNNRTMLPLRFISETFGAKVDFNGAEYTINIIM